MANQWDAISLKNKKKMTKVVRAVVLQMGNSVILRSPVDTGRFRGNWYSSLNEPINSVDTDGEGLNTTVAKIDVGDIFYFINNLPYAEKLEFGSSDQAPQGMVRLTIEEFSRLTDVQAKAILK